MFFLALIGNVFWVALYVYTIFFQNKNKTIIIPKWALYMNLAWELMNCVISSIDATSNSNVIVYAISAGIWSVLDIIIFFQCINIEKKNYKSSLLSFLIPISCLLLCAIVMILLWIQIVFSKDTTIEHNEATFRWAAYTAFGDNIIMSIMFVYAIFWNNKLWYGQSLFVGLSKLFGTLLSTITMGMFNFDNGKFSTFNFNAFPFVLWVGITILLVDIIYCFLIFIKRKKSKLNIFF